MYKIIILAFIMSSCATKRSIIDKVNNKNISTQSVLVLARTSYLKGCVDVVEHESFEVCVKKSKLHAIEIKQILDSNIE